MNNDALEEEILPIMSEFKVRVKERLEDALLTWTTGSGNLH